MNNMPPVVKNLLIINILVFAADYVLGLRGVDLNAMFALHYFPASQFHLYQFLTYMFMHGSFTHLLFNMFALWMFGRIVEQVFGSQRFLIYYMVCGLGAGVMQELVQMFEYHDWLVVPEEMMRNATMTGEYIVKNNVAIPMNLISAVGASGAIYGVLLAFGMAFPDERMFIIPIPFPIKAKYMVGGYVLLELLLAVSSNNDGIAHMAHLGGMLFGFLLIKYWNRHGGNCGMYGGWGGNSWTEINDRSWWQRFTARISTWFHGIRKPKMHVTRGGKYDEPADDESKRRSHDDEIDRILAKVKKHGYGCLSEDEKRKLFSGGK